MARQEVIQYFDDIDNSPISDDEVNVVNFTVNGTSYTMELGPKNKKKFDDALAPYIAVARRATKSSTRAKATTASSSAARNKLIRAWAQENNIEVSKRGRIAADVIEKFNKAHK